MTQHDETERTDDRPLPGDGTYPADAEPDSAKDTTDSPDEEPVYNDRSKLDFDPDDGLYTGTAVTGDTDIPGEHERIDDVPQPDGDGDTGDDGNQA